MEGICCYATSKAAASNMRPTNNLQAKKDKKSMTNVKKETKILLMKKYFQKRQKIYEECQKTNKNLNNEKIFPKETKNL